MGFKNKLLSAMLPLSIGILGMAWQIAPAASSPLDYKTFVNGSGLWICEPAGIMLYRNDTKSVRNIVLSDTVTGDSILDVAENSATLWVLARSGVYQIDFATTTVERLPGEKKGAPGDRLGIDDDYAWAALGDTLWRFDKLGREWFPYPMASSGAALHGVFSSGANVYCVLPSSVKIFSTKDEKWLEFPNKKGITLSPQSRFFLDRDVLLLVDGQNLFRYLISSQSWDAVKAPSPVIDMLSQDSTLYYLTASGMFKYATAASVIQPQDIPDLSRVRSFTRQQDTLICATEANFIKYDMRSKSSGNIQAPQNIGDFRVLKTLMLGGSLVIICPQNIGVYNQSTQFWENVPITAGGAKLRRLQWNDDNGLKLTYAKGYSTQLKGSIQKDYLIDSLKSDNDTSFLYFMSPRPIANLTLHTVFPKGRYLDAYFDNSDITQVPKKGIFFRGASEDRLESARLGTNTVDISQSKTIPSAQYEGAGAVLQSKSSLSTRDRRIVKVQTGAGLLISKTINKVIPYSETGIYNVKDVTDASSGPAEIIVPGSLTVNIDGEEIDTAKYNVVNSTGMLKFNRDDLLDPTSVITVSYQVRTVPDSGLGQVEMLPENHYGNMGYGSVTVSPTDWISPQAGFYYLKTDSFHTLINVAAPTEIRSSSDRLFLKFNPEITYDASTNKKAEAFSLQSRFGKKLSVFTNGLFADSGFKTTDNLDRGYGSLKHDADFKIAYDIKKELPVSYYQRDISSQRGIERRYEFDAGSHFQGFPYCDLTLSRNQVEGSRSDTISIMNIDSAIATARDTTFTDSVVNDTLNRLKDKFRVRLYETSSPFVEAALHINRLKYDLSYTGFSSEKEGMAQKGYGSIFYANGSISPIQRLTLTINGTFLQNPEGSLYRSVSNPSVILQTIDAPPGVDLALRNDIFYRSLLDTDTAVSKALSTVKVQRVGSLTLKPGTWTKSLAWISPILTLNQSISCNFSEQEPGIDAIVLTNRDILTQTFTRGIGANIFPNNDIIWRNDNQWTTADSSTKYYSFNDLKWWFTVRRFWQTRCEYDRDRPRYEKGGISRDFLRGLSQFTGTWNSWLQTTSGVSFSYMGTDTSQVTSMGPDISVTLIKQKWRFIRDLMNYHKLKLAWTNQHGRTEPQPAISYTLYLKVIFYPNISLTTNNTISFAKGAFTTLNGTISAALIF
jgi:hypothetical protein